MLTASSPSSPNMPKEPRTMPAETSSVSDASAIMLPTTGTVVDRVSFAARIAAESALPLMTPLMDRYAVKPITRNFSPVVISCLRVSPSSLRLSSPRA